MSESSPPASTPVLTRPARIAGVAVGALAAVAIVAAAVRQSPRGAIGPAVPDPGRRRVLVVLADPLEDPEAVERVAGAVKAEAPARVRQRRRWGRGDLPAAPLIEGLLGGRGGDTGLVQDAVAFGVPDEAFG